MGVSGLASASEHSCLASVKIVKESTVTAMEKLIKMKRENNKAILFILFKTR